MFPNIYISQRFFLTIFFVITNPNYLLHIQGQEQVPCAFHFGDSLFDNGNNNNLQTLSRVNYPPYGIDFTNATPTGRFSNGKNIVDFINELVGLNRSSPPFATARGSDILKGVNYASGGAGIRDETGRNLGERFALNRQLLNHGITISNIQNASLLTSTRVNLSSCLYTVNIGSNDYINNYFMPQSYETSEIFTPDQYAADLIQQFSRQLTTLYNFGARKIAVFGLGLVGCDPGELQRFPPTNGSRCVDSINNAMALFNNRLRPLIDNLNNRPNAQFILINSTSIALEGPQPAGITNPNTPCCIVRDGGQCAPNQVPCSNRNQYVFWDNFHPTEIMNSATAQRAYNAAIPSDAYPYDIRTLVQQ